MSRRIGSRAAEQRETECGDERRARKAGEGESGDEFFHKVWCQGCHLAVNATACWNEGLLTSRGDRPNTKRVGLSWGKSEY